MNPSPTHHRSTPSSPPTMEPPQHSPLDPDEQMRPSKILKSSESMKLGHHESAPSSPPTMKPSHPSPVDSVDPSPPMDAVASVRKLCQNIDPHEHIDPLISFVENYLQKMNTPSEAESSSSEGWLQTVGDGTKLAAKTIDIISSEAEKLFDSDAVKTVGNVTSDVIKGVEDLYWVFIGLSVAAYAVENYFSVASTERECRELSLNLLKLANDIPRMSDEREKLCGAVKTIVEGAIIFSDYLKLKRGKICRFLSTTTAAAQLEKTKNQLRYVTNYPADSNSLPLSYLQQYWDKDVFLSHSGRQKNFVRQLHRDLTTEGVSCFFDQDRNSLPFAQQFPTLMFKAAEACNVAVVVISNEFILSKWPMKELSAFISAQKSGKNAKLMILPIFFNINPRDLSRIKKDYPGWRNLGVNDDTRVEWQHALEEVRSINGLSFNEDDDALECRGTVVKQIRCFLRGIKPPKLLEFDPVGIEQQVQDVKSLLDMEGAESALAVILYGFGGVGKSTVAASVVQSLNWSSTDFKFCRVEIDESQNKTSHIIKLQKNILSDLGGVNVDLGDTKDGRFKIQAVLNNKCAFLFIDNVMDKDYIEDLLPRDLSSTTKLRIIITSRERNVKAELQITCKEYEVKVLSDDVSRSLLSKTILQSKLIQDNELDEERMINEIAKACRGVPLLLSVFGKHLRVERNKNSYEEALDVLRNGNLDIYRDENLSTKIMSVYHKITNMDVKEAFLDIAAYFHGWKWNLVADVVDVTKLDDLHRRTLVSKNESDEVIVSDILRLLGMNEARLTRFSNYNKELSFALEDDDLDVLENVKGIALVNNNRLTGIKSTGLEAMHKSLRVLMLGDWVIFDGPCNKAFRNLRYLSVGDISAFPFKDPSKLEKLKVFKNRCSRGTNLSSLSSSLKQIPYDVPDVEKFVKLHNDEDKDYDSIGNFIFSLCHEQSPSVGFVEALKASGIHHLDIAREQVMVDDLDGKTIGFIICKVQSLEWMMETQIYKDFQKDSNFIVIAIPSDVNDRFLGLGHGSYTTVMQGIPWATIPHPNLVDDLSRDDRFVVLDKGHIANYDASTLLLGWGLKFYPVTQHSIRKSLKSQSLSEILLDGMNIEDERKATKSKMTFLYVAEDLDKELEQSLTKIPGDVEVLYVGYLTEDNLEINEVKRMYEDATQNMRVPSLSVPDHILFWHRCRYLAREEGPKLYNESHIMTKELHELAKQLCRCTHKPRLVLLYNDRVETFDGEFALDMICKHFDREGMHDESIELLRKGSVW